MTPAEAKKIHVELDAAVRAVAERHGLLAKSGAFRYSETSGRVSFTLDVPDEDGTPARIAKAWNALAPASVAHLIGANVKFSGVEYRVIGWNAACPKKPIVLERAGDRRRAKTTIAHLARAAGVR